MNKISVKNGIDNLKTVEHIIKDKRIGLITNPTGVDKSLRSTIDILNEKASLCCLFAPEHGVRGNIQAGEKIEGYTDEKTGLPVYSLYGHTPHISDEILKNIDIVAFDIQDVGARFYTYMYTLSYAMSDCAKMGKKVLVFDRINPIGAVKPEGTVLERRFSSFVGRFPLATRYNLTIGEYAKYVNETENINCDLTVVKASGWTRDVFYDETDLSWISPSPNLPTVESCFCYIGTCLFEATNISEGRGTTRPFEMIGAPWLDAEKISDLMNKLDLEGVIFRACAFTPTFSKYAGSMCNAVHLHITDRRKFKPFEAALRLLQTIRQNHSEFEFNPPDKSGRYTIDRLLGSDKLRNEDFDVDAFLVEQQAKLDEYENNIIPYHLY